jgi:dienelactone hydrolase
MSRDNAVTARALSFVFLSLLVGLGLGLDATAQPRWHNLEAGEHAVGFRLLQERDHSRFVAGPKKRARPIRIYVWYPAKSSPDVPPMRFARLAALAEDDVWPVEIVGPLRERLRFSRGALAQSLGADGFEALGEQPLRVFEDAEPLAGPFPLIVIGQGLNYESPVAFAALGEYLAGRGFVVATCPLVGTHTPIVKLDVEDLENQVRDLELVIARVRAFPYVRPDKLGVMGFDMGGMSGLLLAMRNPAVDAFASPHSGILFPHPSGLPAAASGYDPLKLRIPWLHVGTQRSRIPTDQTASLLESAVHSERYHLLIDGLQHVDPTSYALVEGRHAVPGFWEAWTPSGVDRHEILSRYAFEFFAAFLRNSQQSLAFLSRHRDPAAASSGVTMEYRPARPPTMTYAQFVDVLLTGDAASALDAVRELRRTEPSHILLNDHHLYRLGYSLLYSWGLSDESMQLAQLNVELNPTSLLATQILSMNHVHRGDWDRAVEAYRALLAMNPADDDARRALEWLQGQRELARSRD